MPYLPISSRQNFYTLFIRQKSGASITHPTPIGVGIRQSRPFYKPISSLLRASAVGGSAFGGKILKGPRRAGKA